MIRVWVCAAWLLVLSKFGQCGNVLVVLPSPVYSHVVPFVPVVEELARRGHNVTFMSPFPQDAMPPGVTQIKVDINMTSLGAAMAKSGFCGTASVKGFKYETLGLVTMATELCRALVKPVINILPPASEKFDLIIAEVYFGQEVLAALGHIYNAPVVAKHPGPLTPLSAYMMGNPNIDSYTPNIRLKMSENMSFIERVINFLVSKTELMYYFAVVIPKLEKLMHELFPQVPDLPPLIDMLFNVSLLVTETHFSVNYHRPLHRNIIEVGGMGVKVMPLLPEDLAKILNESESGVIYFSLGSHFYDPNLEQTIVALMKAFSKLKQRVFFKWSNTSIPDVPQNVVVRSWFPQNTILAHKNVVLYISHGGLNSIYEAVYYGVPVVGTPIFADQPHNINILKHYGLAEYVDFDSITDGVTLLNAINKVLLDPSYRENAKKRSMMLRDRPVPHLEEVTYWLEYVMKYGGDALRPASVRLPWYILVQLDVIGLLALIVLIVILIPVIIVRKCGRRTVRTPSKNTKKVQ